MPVTVTVNAASIRRIITAPGGAGDRYLRRKTEETAALARVNAIPHGTMVATIRATYPRPGTGNVRNEHPAALFVENGTVRHMIFPKQNRPNPRLRFVPTGGSRFVFARKVNHPGNRAYRVLQRALQDALQ